jgi:hypothetical protein
MTGDQKLLKGTESLAWIESRKSVNFHPVASGEDDRFLSRAGVAEQLQRGRDPRVSESEPLPHRYG